MPVALWERRRYISEQISTNATVSGIAMARQFVIFMQGLTKSYPTRKVLDNVNLSFLSRRQDWRARRQRLRQIDACCGSWPLDKEYNGEAWSRGRAGRYLDRTAIDATRACGEVIAGRAKAEGDP